MSNELTELQRRILRIVHGFQHGRDQRRVPGHPPFVLDMGVPRGFIKAELAEHADDVALEAEITGALSELETRKLLGQAWADIGYWPDNARYKRLDGKMISVQLHRANNVLMLFLGDELIAMDGPWFTDFPDVGLPCYRLTRDGLAVLDAQKVPDEPAAKPEYTAKTIPPLDRNNGDWVPRRPLKGKYKNLPDAVQLTGKASTTLRNDLSKAPKFDGGLKGIDRRGRVWRKLLKNEHTIWYLKSTLSAD